MARRSTPAGLSRPGWIAAGVAAVVFIALVVFAQTQQSSSGSEPGLLTATPTPGATDASADQEATEPTGELPFVRRDPDDPLAWGDVDAPVVLVEWVDVRCPFCALFSRESLPTLIDEYVDQGLVRYEVHTVEYFGDQSGDAAVAVLAAAEQGLGMDYLTAVFEAAPPRGHADLHQEALIEFAEEVGVPDLASFTADLDREDLRAIVDQETREAAQLGISSVPFFVVGNRAIVGAQPVEVFQQVLDEAIENTPS